MGHYPCLTYKPYFLILSKSKIMKTIYKVYLTLLALTLMTTNAFADHKTYLTDLSGQPFDCIDISSIAEVSFRQAHTYTVRIEVNQGHGHCVKADITNRKLSIAYKPDKASRNQDNEQVKITLTAPSFNTINLSGIVKMNLIGPWKLQTAAIRLTEAAKLKGTHLETKELKVELSGCSSLQCRQIDAQTATLNLNEAGHLEGLLNSDQLHINCTDAAKLKLQALNGTSGKTLCIKAQDASNLQLKELPFKQIDVTVQNAAQVWVCPTQSLKVKASDAATVRYVSPSKSLQTDLKASDVSTIKRL